MQIAKRQRDAYVAQKEAMKKCLESREKQTYVSDLFKVQALRATLLTSQQNASTFHYFTISFCAMASQLRTKSFNVPPIPKIPEDCLAGNGGSTGASAPDFGSGNTERVTAHCSRAGRT